MSYQAVGLAHKTKVKNPSAKLVLLSLAWLADPAMRVFASIPALSEATGLNRKTIQAAIRHLTEEGILADTGERTGQTGQVKVCQLYLNRPKTGLVEGAEKDAEQAQNRAPNTSPETVPFNRPKNGTLEGETGPIFPPNRPKIGPHNCYITNIPPNPPKHCHLEKPPPDQTEAAAGQDLEKRLEVIRAFDDARAEAWGEQFRRAAPGPTDMLTAGDWLAAGGDPVVCRNHFRAEMAKMAAARRSPPNVLKFFHLSIQSLLAMQNEPKMTVAEEAFNLWKMRVNGWQKHRLWLGDYGPRPGEPGCQCPAELLMEDAQI